MRIAIIVEGKTEIVFRGIFGLSCKRDWPGGCRSSISSLMTAESRPARNCDASLRISSRQKTAGRCGHRFDRCLHGHAAAGFRGRGGRQGENEEWVGENKKFHPHASQHDFEAWLLAYWEKIKRLAESNRPPGPKPEQSTT